MFCDWKRRRIWISSAVRYRQRTVLARQVFFSCSCAAGGATPGATADRWRWSKGAMEFSSASQSRESQSTGPARMLRMVLAISGVIWVRAQQTSKCFSGHGMLSFAGVIISRANPRWGNTTLFARMPREDSSRAVGEPARELCGETKREWRARLDAAANLQQAHAKIAKIQSRVGAHHLEIFVVIKQKSLRFAARAQRAIAPVLDGVQEHGRPQAAF